MAVAGAAGGEVAHEEGLDAGDADGQGLDVAAQTGQIAADVGRVSTNDRSEALVVGARYLPEALDSRTESGA